MNHDHGHWFVVGVLLSSVLVGSFCALRALVDNADLAISSLTFLSPEAFLAGMIAIGALCVGKWWIDNRD